MALFKGLTFEKSENQALRMVRDLGLPIPGKGDSYIQVIFKL